MPLVNVIVVDAQGSSTSTPGALASQLVAAGTQTRNCDVDDRIRGLTGDTGRQRVVDAGSTF